MKITETKLKGCFIIEPIVYTDERGVFFESYNKKKFEEHIGASVHFEQDNHSISKKGVLRGLHYQKGVAAQAKLVRVVQGDVLDVVVDTRKESSTYGSHFKIRLSGGNHKMIFIPKGMAHGFLALEEDTIFNYKCDYGYDKETESGIVFNDPDLGIDWEYPENKLILSSKDRQLSSFKTIEL